jgi:hypothetical protein
MKYGSLIWIEPLASKLRRIGAVTFSSPRFDKLPLSQYGDSAYEETGGSHPAPTRAGDPLVPRNRGTPKPKRLSKMAISSMDSMRYGKVDESPEIRPS